MTMNNELKIQLAQRLDSRDAKELLQNFTQAEDEVIYDLREANDRQADQIADLKRDNDSLVEKIKAATAAAKESEVFKAPKPGDWVIVAKPDQLHPGLKVGDRVKVSYTTTCSSRDSSDGSFVCAVSVDKYSDTVEGEIQYGGATLPIEYFKPV